MTLSLPIQLLLGVLVLLAVGLLLRAGLKGGRLIGRVLDARESAPARTPGAER